MLRSGWVVGYPEGIQIVTCGSVPRSRLVGRNGLSNAERAELPDLAPIAYIRLHQVPHAGYSQSLLPRTN